MKDLMIDLETLGTKPGCAVIEIGAVMFDPWTGETGNTFERKISVRSNLDAGLFHEEETVQWYREQGRLDEICSYDYPIGKALRELTGFVVGEGAREFWAKGGDFEWPILRAAYSSVGLGFFDTRYRAFQCMRGVFNLALRCRAVEVDEDFVVDHRALSDALDQVRLMHISLSGLIHWRENMTVGGVE